LLIWVSTTRIFHSHQKYMWIRLENAASYFKFT
jgi:hypothetical protein